MSFGDNLRRLREARHISVAALSAKVGASRQTIYRYEDGTITNIPQERVEALASALGVLPAELMGWQTAHEKKSREELTIAEKMARDIAFANELLAKMPAYPAEDAMGFRDDTLLRLWPLLQRREKNLPHNHLHMNQGDLRISGGVGSFSEQGGIMEYGAPLSPKSRGFYADFCMTCVGNALLDARIRNGDKVFVRLQDSVENDDIAAIILDGELALCRLYINHEAGQLVVMPEEAGAQPIVLDMQTQERIRIVGRAVGFESVL